MKTHHHDEKRIRATGARKERSKGDEISRVLQDITNAIHKSDNLPQLFESIHQILGRILDVTNFFIAIVDAKERTLHFPYFIDTVDRDFDSITNFNPHESLTGLVVSQREPILLNTEALKEREYRGGIWGPLPLIWRSPRLE